MVDVLYQHTLIWVNHKAFFLRLVAYGSSGVGELALQCKNYSIGLLFEAFSLFEAGADEIHNGFIHRLPLSFSQAKNVKDDVIIFDFCIFSFSSGEKYDLLVAL